MFLACSLTFEPLKLYSYKKTCITKFTFHFIELYFNFQVSHHPPVSAIHVESEKWVFWQEYKLDTRFRGVVCCFVMNLNIKFPLLF